MGRIAASRRRGLFVLRTTLSTDARLVVAGLSRRSLVAAYSIAAVAIALVTSTVSLGVLLATQNVDSPLSLFAAIFLSALIYGAMGIDLARLVEGDMEGSFVLILIFMIDAFVGGPLGGAHGLAASVFPLHFTSEIAVSAMLGGGYPAEWLLYGSRISPSRRQSRWPLTDGGVRHDRAFDHGHAPQAVSAVLDAGFTGTMDDWTALAAAVVWTLMLGEAVVILFVKRPARG